MFTLYLAQLATGYLMTLFLVPYTLLGKKFFRFNLWTPFLLFLLIGFYPLKTQSPELYFFSAPIVTLLLYWFILYGDWVRKAKKQIFLGVATLSAIALLGYLAQTYVSTYQTQLQFWPFLWLFLHFLSSAFLLGSALVAMILGHFYLVIPKLSFGPLRRLTLAFIGAICFRCLLTSFFLVLHWSLWTAEISQDWTHYFLSHIHLLSLRFLAGLLVPSILAYMIWDCVKRESNQSATGILYVACFLVMMGEFGANWYFFQEKILI